MPTARNRELIRPSLKHSFQLFVRTHPQKLSVTNDPYTGELLFAVGFDSGIPSKFALIAGDAIHNLRTALDQATWELIGIDGGIRHRRLAFPMAETSKDYESKCDEMQTPRDDTKKFLISLAAYPGGMGDKLYGLSVLDNLDKHRVLTPIIGATRIGRFEIIQPDGGTITIENCSVTVGEDGRARMVGSGIGTTVKFDKNQQITCTLFLGPNKNFGIVPLMETLVELRLVVSSTLSRFGELVRGRTWC